MLKVSDAYIFTHEPHADYSDAMSDLMCGI